ncbi:MAG: hypothetical protein RLZZ127_276 [Planctomycetota bacterium]
MGSLRAIVLLALLIAVPAAERFVAPGGDDAAAGSATAPWGTLAVAIGRLQAGDTLWVRGGTYRPTAWIDLPRSGTVGALIAIRAWPGETPVVDGQDAIPTWDWDGILNVRNRSYITIEGLTIIRSRWFGIGIASATAVTIRACRTDRTGASGIYASQSQDIRIEDNEVRRACQFPLFAANKGTQECISVSSSTRFTIARNRVWDRLTDVSMGGEGIDVKGSSSDGVVEDNLIHDLVRLGIYIDAYGGTIARIAVRRNTVRACGQGIVVANEVDRGETATVQIHDNLADGNLRRGISVAGWEGGGPIRDIDIVNNTLVGNGPGSGYEQTGLLIDTVNPRSAGIRARNNLIAGSGRQIRTSGQAFVDIRRNLLWGAAPETGIAAIIADPAFVDGDAGDVRLAAGSPAVDAATGATLAATDRLGAARTQDGDGNGSAVADLGAHERGGTLVPMVGFTLLLQEAVEPADGATTALAVAVRRSGATAGRITVAWAALDGTASAGADHGATAGTLVWEDGAGGDRTISVPIPGDRLAEGPETLFLRLSAPTGGAVLGREHARITILDAPNQPPRIDAAAAVPDAVVLP